MKRFVALLLFMLLLCGCAVEQPNSVDQLFQEPENLSDGPVTFSLEDVNDEYVTLLVPLVTETTQIHVTNQSDSAAEFDLYLAPDYNNPILSCAVGPGESGTFSNLSASFYYYVGAKTQGDAVDFVVEE